MKDAKEEDLTPPVNMGESDDAKDVTPSVDAPPTDGMPVPLEGRFPPMRDPMTRGLRYWMLYVFIAVHFKGSLRLQQQTSANVADPLQLRAGQLPELRHMQTNNPFAEGTSTGPQSSHAPLKARQHNPFGEGTSTGPQSSHAPNDINIGPQSSQTNNPFGEGTSRRVQSSHGWPLKARQHNPFGEGTSSGLQSSHNFAPNDIDIEMGGTYSSDHVCGWQRLVIIADSLFDVNIQGAVSLVGSLLPVKNVVLYVVLFLYVVGFLAALGGKLFRNSKMGGTGSVATVLAFLITMALLVIYKI